VRLLRSEVRRLTGRRLFFWLLLVSLFFVALIVVINALQSDKNALNQNQLMHLTDLWLSERQGERLGRTSQSLIATISVLTYLLVVLLGASAVGAEYRAGTVTTILTWEPRRTRLLLARLGAAAIVGMVLFVIVHALFIGGWVLAASLNGSTAGATSDFWRALLFVVLRGTLLAGVIAAISGALATLGRNTAAAMGVWFGYLIVIEAILRVRVKDLIPWMLTSVGGAFYSWDRVAANGRSVSAGTGTLRLVLYVVLIGGGALAVFHRRDVT
jgi:ABC-type transport system involved in multi-copper enzyme maturation permease subunit